MGTPIHTRAEGPSLQGGLGACPPGRFFKLDSQECIFQHSEMEIYYSHTQKVSKNSAKEVLIKYYSKKEWYSTLFIPLHSYIKTLLSVWLRKENYFWLELSGGSKSTVPLSKFSVPVLAVAEFHVWNFWYVNALECVSCLHLECRLIWNKVSFTFLSLVRYI